MSFIIKNLTTDYAASFSVNHNMATMHPYRFWCIIMKLVRLKLSLHRHDACLQKAQVRHWYYLWRNHGKAFRATTALFCPYVESATLCVCALLESGWLDQDRALALVRSFCKNVLPRFYQDALHVRTELVLATFDRGDLSVRYPAVKQFVESAASKGGVRPPFSPRLYSHVRMEADTVKDSVLRSCAEIGDWAGLAIAYRTTYSAEELRDDERYQDAMAQAYAPGGGCCYIAAKEHYTTLLG